MSYNFDIIGVSPVIQFFNHQQRAESSPRRSKAYLGSYVCTLDAFIEATDIVHQKPDWDWDAIVDKIVEFWLTQEDKVRHWSQALATAEDSSLVVGRVANVESLRGEFETLFDA